MNRISAFISYSSEEKALGGRFKEFLEKYCGYKTFIAHDDIPASSVWEKELIKAILKSDFFIPLISKSFKSSSFTDQETGIAFYVGKKIIPISLDETDPYGFISKFQALNYKENYVEQKDNVKELVLTICKVGLKLNSNSVYHKKVISSIVYAFTMSNSFDTTNAIIENMLGCKDFSQELIKEILKAIKENDQVKNAYNLPELIQFLRSKYKIEVD